jgi:hypothetical protein
VFKKKVEDDVKSDTSGHYRKLLVILLNGTRVETSEVIVENVQRDVDDLIAAGVKKWGTDESKFNVILGTRRYDPALFSAQTYNSMVLTVDYSLCGFSFAHLRRLLEEYKRTSGKTMEDTIKSEMSGNLMKTHLALSN